MYVTRQMRRQLERDNAMWPSTLKPIPREQWPKGTGTGGAQRIDVLRSRDFLVQVFRENGFIRLSVNRTQFDEQSGAFRADISWDDLQRLKREAGLGTWWAVEVFPPEAEIINVANMRHLWVLEQPPAFGWHGGTKR